MSGYVEGVPLEDQDQCWHHGPEPVPASYYILCGECGHCYVTADELRREYRAMDERAMTAPWYQADDELWGIDPWVIPAADEIHACPLCTHDF